MATARGWAAGGFTADNELVVRCVIKVVNESDVLGSWRVWGVRGCLVCTHKAVSSGFTGLPVRYHHCLVDVPEGLEVFSQRGIVRVVRQPAHKDFGESSVFLKRWGMHDVQGSVHELMQKHWSAGGEDRRHAEGLLISQQRPSISRTEVALAVSALRFFSRRLNSRRPDDNCDSHRGLSSGRVHTGCSCEEMCRETLYAVAWGTPTHNCWPIRVPAQCQLAQRPLPLVRLPRPRAAPAFVLYNTKKAPRGSTEGGSATWCFVLL